MFVFPLWERIYISCHAFICMTFLTNSTIMCDMLTAVNRAPATYDRTSCWNRWGEAAYCCLNSFILPNAVFLPYLWSFCSVYVYRETHSLQSPRHQNRQGCCIHCPQLNSGLFWPRQVKKQNLASEQWKYYFSDKKNVCFILVFFEGGQSSPHPASVAAESVSDAFFIIRMFLWIYCL